LIDSITFAADSFENQNIHIWHDGFKWDFSLFKIDSVIFYYTQYVAVSIGKQIWMYKNLNSDHYINGDSILEVTDQTQWINLIEGAWCNYNNDSIKGAIYGKLYNWYAVNDPRVLAPNGWHVPNKFEWAKLSNYLGGDDLSGGKLKETGTEHWLSPNTGATNESGFSALPSGCRCNFGPFDVIGIYSFFWTSTENDSSDAWYKVLSNRSSYFNRGYLEKKNGYSVRLVKDAEALIIKNIQPTSANIGDDVTIEGIGFGTLQGTSVVSFSGTNSSIIVSWSNNRIKTKVPVNTCSGEVIIIVDSLKSNPKYFTVLNTNPCDIKIGNQVWMVKNLDVDHYRNGDSIPQVTDEAIWDKIETGAWCFYSNDSDNGSVYGKLYNWYAVNDPRGLAPIGWHVPSDAEWDSLSTFLGGDLVAGGKMKETGTSHWQLPNTGATNESGFSALPGGYRSGRMFFNIGSSGYWWSSTLSYTLTRHLYYYNTEINKLGFTMSFGLSVRLLRD